MPPHGRRKCGVSLQSSFQRLWREKLADWLKFSQRGVVFKGVESYALWYKTVKPNQKKKKIQADFTASLGQQKEPLWLAPVSVSFQSEWQDLFYYFNYLFILLQPYLTDVKKRKIFLAEQKFLVFFFTVKGWIFSERPERSAFFYYGKTEEAEHRCCLSLLWHMTVNSDEYGVKRIQLVGFSPLWLQIPFKHQLTELQRTLTDCLTAPRHLQTIFVTDKKQRQKD